MKNGQGKYTWAKGDYYDGNWKDNVRSGYGTKVDKDKSWY